MENWKDVLDYKGLYQASDLGRIKSLSSSSGAVSGCSLVDNILTTREDDNGYLYVVLYKNGKRKEKHVHVLVWEAFNGKVPKGMHVGHIK